MVNKGCVVVVGQGYVGLPLALTAAERGYKVYGVDIDHQKIADLENGKNYIEDISTERSRENLQSGFYIPPENFDKVREASL